MAIKISISNSDKITSQGINSKFNDIIGGNCILEGFDLSVCADKSLEVTPGKCFIMGAMIEEDSSRRTIVIPSDITSGDYKVVMHYNHENRSITFIIKDNTYVCQDNELLLSSIQIENSEVTGVSNKPKTSTIAKAQDNLGFIDSQLTTEQKLSYSGESVACNESIKAKTEGMSVKGNTFRNLIMNPDNTVSTTPITCKDESDTIVIENSVNAHVSGITVKGDTVQNFVKKPSREQETVLIDMDGEEVIGEKVITDSVAGKIGMSIRGRTLQNISAEKTYSLESSNQDNRAIIHSNLIVGLHYTLQFKMGSGTQQSSKTLKIKNGDDEIFSTSSINKIETVTFQATASELVFLNEANSNIAWKVTNVILVNESVENTIMDYFPGVMSVGDIADKVVLPNGVCDELIGAERVLKKVGKIVLDGSSDENWGTNWGSGNGCYLYPLLSTPADIKLNFQSLNLLCDKLTAVVGTVHGNRIFFRGSSLCISIPTPEYTAAACRQWLSENPITVWYEIDEPRIVDMEENSLKIGIDTTGSNLFDDKYVSLLKKDVIDGEEYYAQGGSMSTNGHFLIENFPFKKQTPYCFSFDYYKLGVEGWNIVTIEYQDYPYATQSNIGSYSAGNGERVVIKSDAGKTVKRIGFTSSNGIARYIKNISLEEGTSGGVYKTPEQSTLSCRLNEPLRSLPGGIYDEITDSGKLIRRTAKALFDGNEGWAINKSNSDTGLTLFQNSNLQIGNKNSLIAEGAACIFEPDWNATKQNTIWSDANKVYLCSTCSSVEELQATLRQSPIALWYELQQYTSEQAEKFVLDAYNETTYITPKTKIKPVLKFATGLSKDVLIKANTAYTVYWKAVEGGENISIDVGGTKVTTPKLTGKVTLTTPATLSHKKMYISGFNTKVTDLMLLDRDNVAYYVEGFKHACEGELGNVNIKSIGKNIFKQVQTALQPWSGSYDNHNIGELPNGCIKSGKRYILKAPSCSGNIRINFVGYKDGEYEVLRSLTHEGGTGGVSITKNFERYFISAYRLSTDDVEITNIQVGEDGDDYNTNNPYTEDVKSLVLDAPLRRISDSVYDSIEKRNDRWYLVRRTWQVTFNGTEGWFAKWNNPAAMLNTYPTLNGYPLPLQAGILCDTMPANSSYTMEASAGIGMAIGNDWNANNPKFMMRIPDVDFSMSKVDKVKQWLADNPTTVVYQLANPIVTELDQDFDFTAFDGKTYITTDTAIKPVIKIDSGFDRNADIKASTEYTVAWNSSAGGANIDIDLGGWNVTVPRTAKLTKITTPSVLEHKKLKILTPNVTIKDVMVYEGEWTHGYKEGIVGVGGEGAIKLTSNNTEYRNSIINSDVSLGVPHNKVTIEDDWFRIKYNQAKGDWFAVDFPCRDTFTSAENILYARMEVMKTGEYNWPNINLISMSRSNGGGYSWGLFRPSFEDKEIGYSEVLSVRSSKFYDSTIEYKNLLIGAHVVNAEYDIKIRKPMIINLTKWFGRGNEPSKEWCDRNIKFVTDEGNLVLGDASIDSKAIPLNEPLYSLPNGTCDELMADGTLIRRVGKAVLDENVNWSTVSSDGETTRGEYVFNKNSIPINSINIYCDKLIPVGGVYGDKKGRGICFDGHGDIWVRLNNSELSELSEKGIKQWFKENPTTVLYELKNPVIEKVPISNLNLNTYDKITNVTSVSQVKPQLSFKMPTNLRAILRQTTSRISEAEKLIDELILPNLIETDYERTLIEFDFEVTKLKNEEEN